MLTLMDGLLIALGFTGALTLVWLFRRIYFALTTGPGVSVSFGPAAAEALTREIAKARHEVLVLGSPTPDVAVALNSARSRKAALDVLLDRTCDGREFAAQGVQPRQTTNTTPDGVMAIVDDRVVFGVNGQTVVVTGYPAFVAACRQHFATFHPVGQVSAPPVISMSPAPTPAPAPTSINMPQPSVRSAPSPVDELLAAVARGQTQSTHHEEEEEEEEANAPPVTRATAELFARLRQEASARDDSAERVA